LILSLCLAQSGERVEIGRMRHVATHDAIYKHGETTVLIYNGGTAWSKHRAQRPHV